MLAVKAFVRQLFLLFAMAALLFTLAGTLHYWQAWTFLAVYFTSSMAIILYLLRKDRKLLERRLGGGPLAEKQNSRRSSSF
jgi:O-antigen/teichoic acid export membrane protein